MCIHDDNFTVEPNVVKTFTFTFPSSSSSVGSSLEVSIHVPITQHEQKKRHFVALLPKRWPGKTYLIDVTKYVRMYVHTLKNVWSVRSE